MANEPLLVVDADAVSHSSLFSLSSLSASSSLSPTSTPPSSAAAARAFAPVVRGTPDTSYASSDVPLGRHPAHLDTTAAEPANPRFPNSSAGSPRNTRSLTITVVPNNSNPNTTPVHVLRKPVASTASSLAAIVESTGPGPLAVDDLPLPRPDTRFARSPSVDSPILYEYPEGSLAPPLPVVTGQRTAS